MYFIYGSEKYLIDQKVNDIINESQIDSILRFNQYITIDEIMNQISTFSLFDNKRILVFNNLQYFEKINEKDINLIIKSLSYKPKSTTVIFTYEVEDEKDNKNDLINYLKDNAKCYKLKKLSDKEIENFAKEKISDMGATISNIDLYYFLSKIPSKLSIIASEIEKLISLDKNISRSNIDDLVQKHDLGSAFDFINAFHDGNTELLFKSFYEKMNKGETIQNFINQIANVLEICSRIYSLRKCKYNETQICTITKKHAFIIKKNIEFMDVVGYNKICKYISIIADMDVKIKKGLIVDRVAFERFLLETVN